MSTVAFHRCQNPERETIWLLPSVASSAAKPSAQSKSKLGVFGRLKDSHGRIVDKRISHQALRMLCLIRSPVRPAQENVTAIKAHLINASGLFKRTPSRYRL